VKEIEWHQSLTLMFSYDKFCDKCELENAKILYATIHHLLELSSVVTEYGCVHLSLELNNNKLKMTVDDTGDDLSRIKNSLDSTSSKRDWKVIDKLIEIEHYSKLNNVDLIHSHSLAGNT